jgi:hypothetical protein
MKSLFASCAFAVMATLASTASAAPLTLSDVGGVDPLLASGNVKSGDPQELAWISSVTNVPVGNLTYTKLPNSSGSNWQQLSGSNTLFAFNLGSDPTWFMVKTGAGSSFDHFLFTNTSKMEWAVVDFSELGFEDVNIEKFGHVAISSDPQGDEDVQLATVPEPASLALFGLGLSATVAAIRRRRKAQ